MDILKMAYVVRLVAWRQLGICLAKCIDLRPNFQVQNQL